ncbi:sulfite exporter TauE/SafE family protein [Chelativorans sp. Marseille-P2723]|uniref:sulfite exporter TauE/SafE family protein n=1 Tax=Chelativorans sp. Marseille-P2723 TaxID=2709133 RepID=UPI0015710D85|nr:sulfite exporter TauE/SafE family protein [Chelativorans sp. Marseille-P2723]
MDIPLSEIATFVAAISGAAVVAGILAGLFGIGGGAVLVPVFYQIFGLLDVDEAVRMHLSVGTSLAIIVPTSLRSWRAHYTRGAVDMSLLRSFVISVPIGVVIASITAAHLSSAGLRVIFAAVLGLLGLKLMFNHRQWHIKGDIPGNPIRGMVGFLIGYLSTLLGIGGGILNNSFMTLFGRPIHQAVATSSGVGVLISIPGFLGYIWAGWGAPGLPIGSTGFVNWIAVALVIPITLLVTPLGVRMAHALQRRHLEIGFGAFALFVSARFAWSLL